MNDREMLELAAKAAGYLGYQDGCAIVGERGQSITWNPLADDGDALRLAVKLDIEVEPVPFGGRAIVRDFIHGEQFDEESPDRMAATRRAIVRAAAAIGEKMP